MNKRISPRCFRCNGSGRQCNVCGESLGACECEDGPEEVECPDCKGKGK
jgi:hypothetical protein